MNKAIVPAILEQNWSAIEDKLIISRLYADKAHIDLIDGIFAPFKTYMDPKPFLKYSDDLFMELHMMVDEPINYLSGFMEAGFSRFIGQVEKMSDIAKFIKRVRRYGKEAWLAVDMQTYNNPLSRNSLLDLNEFVNYEPDGVLIMTVKAGKSSQTFIPGMLEKVKKLKTLNPKLSISIDGGINDKTIIDAKKSGADIFISGSFLFNGDFKKNYSILENLINV